MKLLAMTTAMALAATPVLAQSAAESSGVNSLAGIPPKTQDFVTKAASSDMFEIESSKLALDRGNDAAKGFAQQMISDHQKTSEELKQLVEGGSVEATIPTEMTAAHQEMLEELKAAEGEEFSQEYLSAQEDAHEDAVDLFQRYGEEGDNAELKAWAAKTVPALEHHLKMVEDMNDG
nr:hypothetical protein RKHAN_02267 [Rhizobium sp. Khangiran2]